MYSAGITERRAALRPARFAVQHPRERELARPRCISQRRARARLERDLRPEILFASAVGKYDGYHAVKNLTGEWSVTPTPFAFASGGLVRSPSGLPSALANDGAFGASLWGFFADGWEHISDVPGKATHYERSFAQAPNGDLYVGVATDVSELELGKYDGSWSMTNLGQTPAPVPVAVSPEGAPHVFHWEAPGAEWLLRWMFVPEAQETVFSLGSNTLLTEEQRAALVVTAADVKNPMGRPHGLVVRGAPGSASEVVYATREGASAWSLVHVETAPSGVALLPLGGVTDDLGNVRLFYARIQYASPNAGQVVVVWPKEDGTVGKANVMEGLSAVGATFERDGIGRIHVALYFIVSGSNLDVRYVILGAERVFHSGDWGFAPNPRRGFTPPPHVGE